MNTIDDECEKTSLPKAFCSHCRGLDEPPTPTILPGLFIGDRYAFAFPARFESTCLSCRDPIDINDSITRTIDGHFVHTTCLDKP